ncbi:MAG: hypothetical protein H8D94_01445 [Candidatus Pelagibacter sp.]|nr:hypothetical protein [Candidatus Pelagibacter sp.]
MSNYYRAMNEDFGDDTERVDDNFSVEKKDDVERILINMWTKINMDIPNNYEDIVQYCYEDVCETADPHNWSDGDVVIAFRRWIESHG